MKKGKSHSLPNLNKINKTNIQNNHSNINKIHYLHDVHNAQIKKVKENNLKNIKIYSSKEKIIKDNNLRKDLKDLINLIPNPNKILKKVNIPKEKSKKKYIDKNKENLITTPLTPIKTTDSNNDYNYNSNYIDLNPKFNTI